MKKLGKWVGAIVAVLLVLVVLATLVLRPLAERREVAFGPLSEDVLREIMPEAPPGSTAPKDGRRESAAPTAPVPIVPDTIADDSDDETGDSARNPAQLARTLTREELLGDSEYRNNPVEDVYRHIRDRGWKVRESIAWATDSDTDGGTAHVVGRAALQRGDIEEARDYLRAALEASVANEDYSGRSQILADLASVEEDPEVATALLEASCRADRPEQENVLLPFYVQNALYLSIFTGSEALAEHYYARWNEVDPGGKQILGFLIPSGGEDQIEAWLRQRDPDFFENATHWEPMQPFPPTIE